MKITVEALDGRPITKSCEKPLVLKMGMKATQLEIEDDRPDD